MHVEEVYNGPAQEASSRAANTSWNACAFPSYHSVLSLVHFAHKLSQTERAHTHTQTQTHVLVHGHPTLGSSEFSLQYLTLTTDAYKHIEYILYRYINNSAMSFPWAYSRVLSQALKKLEDVEQDLQGG